MKDGVFLIKKTIIYGAGDICALLLDEHTGGGNKIYRNYGKVEFTAIADADPKLQGRRLFGLPIIAPDAIPTLDYSKVLVTAQDDENRRDIWHTLMSLGVPKLQIQFLSIRSDPEVSPRIDYIRRYMNLYDWSLPGNVAECGVHNGDMAFRLNWLFRDKKLYLFDTFAGFDEHDIDAERDVSDERFLYGQHNHYGGWNHDVERVMKRMPLPENVIIKQGRVPDTFEGVNDKFCFVNLDMDLYAPTLAALKFFWGKMVSGGLLLLHDYFCDELPGVKKAVDEFDEWLGCKCPKTHALGAYSLAVLKM
jgi:hypothetical protein